MSTQPSGVGIVPAHLVSATAILRWSDGKVQAFDFDTRDQGIGLEYESEVDVIDKTPDGGTYRVTVPGERRRMAIRIAGRGPVSSASEPVAVER